MKAATLETRQKLYDKLNECHAHLAIFDNAETVDRYTIYFDIEGTTLTAEKFVVISSEHPTAEDGMWLVEEPKHSSAHENQAQRITLLDLPEDVAQQIINELNK